MKFLENYIVKLLIFSVACFAIYTVSDTAFFHADLSCYWETGRFLWLTSHIVSVFLTAFATYHVVDHSANKWFVIITYTISGMFIAASMNVTLEYLTGFEMASFSTSFYTYLSNKFFEACFFYLVLNSAEFTASVAHE